eukprot:405177-Hanusia_phi.AAC.2
MGSRSCPWNMWNSVCNQAKCCARMISKGQQSSRSCEGWRSNGGCATYWTHGSCPLLIARFSFALCTTADGEAKRAVIVSSSKI